MKTATLGSGRPLALAWGQCPRVRLPRSSLLGTQRQKRTLLPATGPGQGPSQSNDITSEQLAPILFTFTDTPSVGMPPQRPGALKGAVPFGTASSSTSAATTERGAVTGPDAGTAAGVAPGAVHEVGHETSPHTAQSSRSGNGAPATPSTSQRAPSPSSPGPSSSYSDYYRQANTPYVRPSTPPTADAATQVGPSIPDPTAQPSTSYNTTALDAPSSSTTPTAPASDDSPEVSAAFARAQAALTRAELNLDDMQRLSFDAASLELRGAPPSRWQRAISIARSVIIMGALAVGMLASHAFGLAVQWAGATVGAALIAGWGLRKGSLSHSGAIAAFCVGCGTLGSSLRFGTTLIAFFLSSSKLTTYKEEMKEGLEENAKKGGQRTWVQVGTRKREETV